MTWTTATALPPVLLDNQNWTLSTPLPPASDPTTHRAVRRFTSAHGALPIPGYRKLWTGTSSTRSRGR